MRKRKKKSNRKSRRRRRKKKRKRRRRNKRRKRKIQISSGMGIAKSLEGLSCRRFGESHDGSAEFAAIVAMATTILPPTYSHSFCFSAY